MFICIRVEVSAARICGRAVATLGFGVAAMLPVIAAAQIAQPPQSLIGVPAAVAYDAPLQPVWTAADVLKEQARCAQLMKGLAIVARPLPPLREHDCGAPAPLELISVGTAPQVSFSPPVTVTCDMAVALHRWIKADIQPLARKHLGADVIRIDTMSSYSCRTAYNRKNTKLSEHGKANAIDLRSFTTAKGGASEVLADWGPTGREIAAQVAIAKKFEAEHPVAKAPIASGTATASRQPLPASSGVATGSIVRQPSMPGIAVTPPTIALGSREGGGIGLQLPSASNTGLGLANSIGSASRLGGPKANEIAIDFGNPGARTDFLRAAHDAACRIFGTVLGPEANAAHRNHFHLDMAERKLKSICE